MQEYGLKLIMLIEGREQAIEMTDAFKMAVISADPATYIPVVFPEWMTKSDADIDDKDIADSTGTWVFTDDEVDLDEVDRMFEQAMASTGSTQHLTASDLGMSNDDDDW